MAEFRGRGGGFGGRGGDRGGRGGRGGGRGTQFSDFECSTCLMDRSRSDFLSAQADLAIEVDLATEADEAVVVVHQEAAEAVEVVIEVEWVGEEQREAAGLVPGEEQKS